MAQNVLIYRLGSLGDTIMALPCFHRIRQSFPDAKITVLTNRPVAAKAAALEAVLGREYFFDGVLDYPVGTRSPRALWGLVKQIRALKIDTVINLTAARSPRSVTRDRWFFRLAGVKRMLGGPAVAEDFTIAVDPVTGEQEWEASRLARRLEGLGPIDLSSDASWDPRLTPEELGEAARLLAPLGDGPFLVISAGTKMQAKDWEEANWTRLISRLPERLPGWSLVMTGAADEAALSDRCLRGWQGPRLNLCGSVSPRVSAAVMQRAELFVGHDSGPMHLAACVGTPCVAIFAARNVPRQWFPRGDHHRILYHRTECAGCGLETCTVEQKRCILSISVEEVEAAVREIIGAVPAPTES